MKFPKPRTLSFNDHDDLATPQPKLFKELVNDIIFPPEGSPRDRYLQSTIDDLKERSRKKSKAIKLNQLFINRQLYFLNICLNPEKGMKKDTNVKGLVDTGAANSLIHTDIIKRYGIKYEPGSMVICTATGTDSVSIKGTAHIKFRMRTTKNNIIETCANFIVTEKLNGMDCILGADFLMENNNVVNVSKNCLVWRENDSLHRVRIADSAELEKLETINIYTQKHAHKILFKPEIECKDCLQLDKNSHKADTKVLRGRDVNGHPIIICEDKENGEKILKQNLVNTSEYIDANTEESTLNPTIGVYSHSVQHNYEEETLPDSADLFADSQELKEEILEKKISINDGDYSHCPPEHLGKLMSLMEDFKDRFSESKLDLEITDMYTADLETIPGKVVNQKCRRLPTDRFVFAKKAIDQLIKMGVVSESDSAWRSNVVMVPKPQSGQLRENSKSDMLDKSKKVDIYRICLDFRELNNSLVFPKNVQFVNLENLLHKLKNKVCVSMDISSAFFIIPINEADRYKTSFWVNDLSYEFNSLVMGLKSSPYHLKMFMNIVFGPVQFEKLKKLLSQAERDLLPSSFADIVISYFDDCFVFADNYEQLLVCFKICLMAAREAKIKFSVEKTTFFTTKIKVLGYSFDTKDALLTMDRLKSSAITNMKKPSSLFELHSRLCAFQYQSIFLPYLKHILYPLHYMLRKREWKWGDQEEEAWSLAKQLCGLGLRLTIPDKEDDLVLTTDASKVAASACLFRVRNKKLELVAVNSKYFNVTDLNKCSYVLESVALAYGLKCFASYILNCEGKIKVFTDARSLIYCKRMSTHSILLNSTLAYLTNFVTLSNMELYHLPGDVNVLADVMSRAIADNLNCALNREHPISKQWATVIPVIPETFNVDRNTLFKFLTCTLKPEIEDKHDRRMRKLVEPKSVQQWFDISQGATSEERFYNAIRLLEQWNDTYEKHEKLGNISVNMLSQKEQRAHEALMRLITEKNKECTIIIENILEKTYADIKDTPIYKKIRKSLVEASKQLISINGGGLTKDNVTDYCIIIDDIMVQISEILPESKIPTSEGCKAIIKTNVFNSILNYGKTVANGVQENNSTWEGRGHLKYRPEPYSSDISLRTQKQYSLKPNEIIKLDLDVRVHPRAGYIHEYTEAEFTKKMEMNVETALMCVGTDDYNKISIQNLKSVPVTIPEGTAILIVNTSRISYDTDTGTFSSERQETLWNEVNTDSKGIALVRDVLSTFEPDSLKIGEISIRIPGEGDTRARLIDELRGHDNDNLPKISTKLYNILPVTAEVEQNREDSYKTDTQALLALDLLKDKKLSLHTLIKLQGEDDNIQLIRENLTGNQDAYGSYILKNGLVCKKFTVHHIGVTFLGIYIPTAILRAVMQYVHRRYLHTSVTQTKKEFSANYYHPQSDKFAKEICRECVICTQSRNMEKRDITIGRQRTLKPERPRESISADILYFPKSSSGYTHGLLIADLFSLYVSFFPMRSKNSAEVAKAFDKYLSAMCPPKNLYTDSDQSFRGEVETLLRLWNITHITSYPYTQKQNAVESQVRIFKNAYRAAILENDIFKIPQWDKLYPMVICRINVMISKYGMSRESVHFGTIVDSSLPLIVDCEAFSPLEDDLKQLCDRFRDKIGRFLMRKKRDKELYKIGKSKHFYMYELVMRTDYTADNLLAPVYKGPFRIVHLDSGGARLRNIKTKEEQSVSFEHMRKIHIDELLTLLPQNFDSEIMAALDNYRYKRSDKEEEPGIDRDTSETGSDKADSGKRVLRSGRLYQIDIKRIGDKTGKEAEKVYWRTGQIYKRDIFDKNIPILTRHRASDREFIAQRDFLNTAEKNIFAGEYMKTVEVMMTKAEKRKYYSDKKCSFSSAEEGTMIIRMKKTDQERPGKRVKFKEVVIHFYTDKQKE